MIQLRFKVGQTVWDKLTNDAIQVVFLHSGNYDYEYTGVRESGEYVYFNGEDVYDFNG